MLLAVGGVIHRPVLQPSVIMVARSLGVSANLSTCRPALSPTQGLHNGKSGTAYTGQAERHQMQNHRGLLKCDSRRWAACMDSQSMLSLVPQRYSDEPYCGRVRKSG